MLCIKMMVGDVRIDHLGPSTWTISPTRSVELVAEFHTVHTHSFDFSIFVQLASGFQPLSVKNDNEHEKTIPSICALPSGSKGEEDYIQEGQEGEEDAVLQRWWALPVERSEAGCPPRVRVSFHHFIMWTIYTIYIFILETLFLNHCVISLTITPTYRHQVGFSPP